MLRWSVPVSAKLVVMVAYIEDEGFHAITVLGYRDDGGTERDYEIEPPKGETLIRTKGLSTSPSTAANRWCRA